MASRLRGCWMSRRLRRCRIGRGWRSYRVGGRTRRAPFTGGGSARRQIAGAVVIVVRGEYPGIDVVVAIIPERGIVAIAPVRIAVRVAIGVGPEAIAAVAA